jgi:hypothetical protein
LVKTFYQVMVNAKVFGCRAFHLENCRWPSPLESWLGSSRQADDSAHAYSIPSETIVPEPEAISAQCSFDRQWNGNSSGGHGSLQVVLAGLQPRHAEVCVMVRAGGGTTYLTGRLVVVLIKGGTPALRGAVRPPRSIGVTRFCNIRLDQKS